LLLNGYVFLRLLLHGKQSFGLLADLLFKALPEMIPTTAARWNLRNFNIFPDLM
jgi:hypothetical protein